MTRFVLFHPTDGIFLGNCMGLGFWSLLDPVGQDEAVTFADRIEAIDAKAVSISPDEFCAVEIRPVEVANPPYATLAECVAAGLPSWEPGRVSHPALTGGQR